MQDLLTAPEVARRLRLSLRTVREMIAANTLPVVRLGRRTLVAPASLERFVAAHETTGSKPAA
jgi:excisionase family DNA binding protein